MTRFVSENSPLFVLTGAGCSTASGLGDYRDVNGQWKRRQPITGSVFINNENARKRYWARSAAGWPSFSQATPNIAHTALATLQTQGFIGQLVTQNVDGLHQQAGHLNTVDLHGRLDTVSCLSCGHKIARNKFQDLLVDSNPTLFTYTVNAAPDGDADLAEDEFNELCVPGCPLCHGILKPDVVFFGENVDRQVVDQAMQSLQQAKGMLVIGSSLMVFSGFRFCKRAAELTLPLAIVNQGRTRADELCDLKVEAECGQTLKCLIDTLSSSH